MNQLNYVVRGLPALALVLSILWAVSIWQDLVSPEVMAVGRAIAEKGRPINAVKVMTYGPPPAVGLMADSDRRLPPDRISIASAVGWSLLISAALALIHWLLSFYLLTKIRIHFNERISDKEVKEIFYRLYSNADSLPFTRSGEDTSMSIKQAPDNERQRTRQVPDQVVGTYFIKRALTRAPLKKRVAVIAIVVVVWIFWPFSGFGPLSSHDMGMYVGYPIILWQLMFGVSELLFLGTAKAFA